VNCLDISEMIRIQPFLSTNQEIDRPAITHTQHPYYSSQVFHIAHPTIHPWTPLKSSDPVWPLRQGTGTADEADHITVGSR